MTSTRALSKSNKRHKKILGRIEKCFHLYREQNIEVISIEQIKDWIVDNYTDGISKRRLSVLLYRKPQFIFQKKFRMRNSNTFDTYWSLGELENVPEISLPANWVEVVEKSEEDE
tara:strand:- start:26 stop:370 length:345 start_codon:yes stop_codon:yes gene_type:complete